MVDWAARIVFWLCTAIVTYVYVGYPLLAGYLARKRPRPVAYAPVNPSISIIVAAFNEERGIAAKLRNLLDLDYPADRIEVIVASDGSTDATDGIVRDHPDPRVRLMRVEGRVGKTACQNAAAAAAQGEIIVFTDATTEVQRDALRRIAGNFADSEVGCVAGCLVYRGKDDGATSRGGTAYWGYEIGLRRAESAMGSLVGVSGCLYAVRRSAYRPIRPDLISDFVIASHMRELQLRTVLETGAICFEDTLDHGRAELGMRVRVAIRSINALVVERRFLNPLRHGMYAWQMISHKMLRYASPVFCLGALVASALLVPRPFYTAAFAAQVIVIVLGLLAMMFHRTLGGLPGFSQSYYFLLTNLASALALICYLRGDRMVTWRPIR